MRLLWTRMNPTRRLMKVGSRNQVSMNLKQQVGVIVIVSVAHSLADEYKIARTEFRKNDPRLTKSKGSSRILFEKTEAP